MRWFRDWIDNLTGAAYWRLEANAFRFQRDEWEQIARRRQGELAAEKRVVEAAMAKADILEAAVSERDRELECEREYAGDLRRAIAAAQEQAELRENTLAVAIERALAAGKACQRLEAELADLRERSAQQSQSLATMIGESVTANKNCQRATAELADLRRRLAELAAVPDEEAGS